MFRFLRITLILWLLSVALIGGAALYGRTHDAPNELQALGFDVCEGKPCFMGITPGVTRQDNMSSNLSSAIVEYGDNLHTVFYVQQYEGEILFSALGKVSLIVLKTPNTDYPISTVGNFLSLYGSPCGVVRLPDGQTLEFVYPEMQVTSAVLNRQSIAVDTPLDQIIINDVSYDPTPKCKRENVSIWKGLTYLRRYK
ncbi:MAG: hypothetical protein IT324_21825 [Anaerolineae bacterium]|nr:hypothetical protein [Anaerolineae bacterium]